MGDADAQLALRTRAAPTLLRLSFLGEMEGKGEGGLSMNGLSDDCSA